MTRTTRYLGLLLALILALAACGGTPSKGGDGSEGAPEFPGSVELDEDFDPNAEIAFGWPLEATSWDPHQGVSDYDLTYLFPVYDRLIMVDPAGEMKPMLATEWEVGDTSITLTLRDGVTFSDGTPFNAEAVKVNLDRARGDEVSKIKSQLTAITAVEVIDPSTVRIDISGKPGLVLGMLTARAGMIASPAAIAAGTLHSQPVGVGAYVAATIAQGNQVRYEKTPGYWDPDAQRVAAMVYRYMPESQTAINALLTGEIQIAHLEADQVGTLGDRDLTVIAGGFSAMQFIEVNNTMKPFDDPNVRLAMNLAINRDEIANGLNIGLCDAEIQPWPSSSFAYDEEIGNGSKVWAYDPEKAKELLKEAGYPEGFTFKAITSTVSYYPKLSEVLQAQLAEVGITMEFEIAPRPQMVDAYSVKKTLPAMVAANPAHVDPEYTNTYVFAAGSVNNPGNPLPDNMLDLLDQAANEPDQGKRADLYTEFMGLAVDEPTHFMPLCNAKTIYALDEGVSGIEPYQNSVRDLRGVAYTP